MAAPNPTPHHTTFSSKRARMLVRLIRQAKIKLAPIHSVRKSDPKKITVSNLYQFRSVRQDTSLLLRYFRRASRPSPCYPKTYSFLVSRSPRAMRGVAFSTPYYPYDYPAVVASRSRTRSMRFFRSTNTYVLPQSKWGRITSAAKLRLKSSALSYPVHSTLSVKEWESIVSSELRIRRLRFYKIRLKRLAKRRPTSTLAGFRFPRNVVSTAFHSYRPAEYPAAHPLLKGHIFGYLDASYTGVSKALDTMVFSLSTYYPSFLSRSTHLLKLTSRSPSVADLTLRPWILKWTNLLACYTTFALVPKLDLYIRLHKSQKKEVRHNLRFRFNGRRLHIIFEDYKSRSVHFFTTPGLFLKYFQGKKSLKKNKAMKHLMSRFLRKILLILKLERIGIVTRGIPVHFDTMLNALFKPLSHPFPDPLTGSVINESASQSPSSIRKKKKDLSIAILTMLSPKPYSYQKTKKQGRVKRKIRRKLVRLNNVID